MNRLWNTTLGLISIIVLAAPMAVIATFVRICDGRPVFFRQIRVGQHLRPFVLYKFRTMSGTAGDTLIVSAFGQWLRRTRLDELPQLINVIIGDMTIIGPRPEVPRFVDPSDESTRRVTRVTPGLFDNATLAWLHEEDVLGMVEDADAYYRQYILPDKLQRSLRDIERKSLINDFRTMVRAALALTRRAPVVTRPAASEETTG